MTTSRSIIPAIAFPAIAFAAAALAAAALASCADLPYPTLWDTCENGRRCPPGTMCTADGASCHDIDPDDGEGCDGGCDSCSQAFLRHRPETAVATCGADNPLDSDD